MSSMLDYGGGDPQTIQIPGDTGAETDDSAGSDPVKDLQDAIDALMSYQKGEKDAVDRATASKVLAQLHSLQAKDQQDQEQAMKGTITPRYVRKSQSAPTG